MKKTILVVEDEKLSRKLIVGTLINHGFECLTAENGQYALDILENNHCDLILTDLFASFLKLSLLKADFQFLI